MRPLTPAQRYQPSSPPARPAPWSGQITRSRPWNAARHATRLTADPLGAESRTDRTSQYGAPEFSARLAQTRERGHYARRAMRKTALLLLVGGLVAASSHVARASDQFAASFQLSYLSTQVGASSGLSTVMTWDDLGALAG